MTMFHNILLSVDPAAPSAPPVALLRALDGDPDSQLRAMAVLEPFDHLYAVPREWLDRKLADSRKRWHSDLRGRLRALLRPIAGQGIRIGYKVVDGYPTNALLSDVRVAGRDLLVVRTQTLPEESRRIGSLAEELLLRSPVTLCCIRDVPADYEIRRILATTDLSENSVSALEAALTLAEERGAHLTLLHLVHRWGQRLDAGALRRLHVEAKKALKEWRTSRPHLVSRRVPVEEEVVQALNPAEGILKRARELPADLIVIASHGWTGVAGVFFGSTARRVVRGADVPVLVTRSPSAHGGRS
jgi:nucleotide-binding universal stress UspA family protein